MKNKKLIATVASLCLVLVAVVAAVVGVLAAAQQSVKNQIKVGYEAKANVYATVSLNGKTQFNSTTGAAGAWGTDVSTSFNTMEATRTPTDVLSFEYNDSFTISESATGEVGRYAVYRFTFVNHNPTHYLNVSMTYTEGSSADADNNVKLFWVKSDSSDLTVSLAYASEGTLTTTELTNEITLTNGSADVYKNTSKNNAGTSIVPAGTGNSPATAATQYIYLVVAVKDLNADATFDLDNNTKSLVFSLEGFRLSA